LAEHDSHDLLDWLTLLFVAGIGTGRLNLLLARLKTPAAILGSPPDRLADVAGIGPGCVRRLTDPNLLRKARSQAEQELDRLQDADASIICRTDPRYPAQLKTIQDPPLLLYCRGDIDALHGQAVALVGSRAATTYGRRTAHTLARDLAAAGIIVVSGLALGIDSEAHRGALAGGGRTVAVLGCGLNVVYPRNQKRLYEEIAGQGCLVSEYPLHTRPDRYRFPARNRIISGLAAATVIVEATLRSGSLITARLALDQGREVFAVPGRIDSPKSEGAHRLIQQGAHLVHDSADICSELELGCRPPDIAPETVAGSQPETGSDGDRVLACLDVYPMDIETIAVHSGLDLSRLHGVMLDLELKGLVRQLPGQQYERITG